MNDRALLLILRGAVFVEGARGELAKAVQLAPHNGSLDVVSRRSRCVVVEWRHGDEVVNHGVIFSRRAAQNAAPALDELARVAARRQKIRGPGAGHVHALIQAAHCGQRVEFAARELAQQTLARGRVFFVGEFVDLQSLFPAQKPRHLVNLLWRAIEQRVFDGAVRIH